MPSTTRAILSNLGILLAAGYCEGKLPLFVLGSGISADRVPLLSEMAEDLIRRIEHSDLEKKPKDILLAKGTLIQRESATRSDAAQFFSALQTRDLQAGPSNVWKQFCEQLVDKGLTLPSRQFVGILRHERPTANAKGAWIGPSAAHDAVASLSSQAACHILNLNYDALLYLAMSNLRKKGDPSSRALHLIALHSVRDIRKYYSSQETDFQPAVTNARGDIFYVRCANTLCPQCDQDHALDYRYNKLDYDELLICPACHLETLRIQLSFPSYETKEQLLQPVLEELRYFIASRTSMVIAIGVSGRWDPYLLEVLFQWTLSYRIPLVDVKPHSNGTSVDFFEQFRRRFFPSITTVLTQGSPCYVRCPATADEFFTHFHPLAINTIRNSDRPLSASRRSRKYMELTLPLKEQ